MTVPKTIPATITITELSEAIGRHPGEIVAELASRGDPHGPEEVLGAELAVAIAKALGARVEIEPRDLALEHLYSRETRGEPALPHGRAGALVEAVLSSLDTLDLGIEEVSEHWSVSRMPVIDRNILRIALHELAECPDVPTPVIISEAVRLAGTYSTERSAAFVNGVLASLARQVRPE